MNKVKVKDFPLSQYFADNFPKRRICLHHTVGSTADGAISWWRKQREKVGTAYVIDKDGTVHEVFNDQFYAYQFGLSNCARRMEFEQSTIGIELVNEGYLFYASNRYRTEWNATYKGEVVEGWWRGNQRWAAYTEAQYIALSELLIELSEKHDIALSIKADLEYDLSVFDTHTVLNHAQVRRDKTDLSPAFDFAKLQTLLSEKSNT
jgi:N-acetyl-anhydromuramyl-L-alanine amidase AmpD